jgi:DNA polymerase-4
LEKAGIRSFTDLRRWKREDLQQRFGSTGERLWHLARGEYKRQISAKRPVKSISKETTFAKDTAALEVLDGHLWRLAEQCSDRGKAKGEAGHVVTLKLKRSDHTGLTRRRTLPHPTNMTDVIYRTARELLELAVNEGPFRLIGVGIADLTQDFDENAVGDLLDPNAQKRADVERASDEIKRKFGKGLLIKGRSLN